MSKTILSENVKMIHGQFAIWLTSGSFKTDYKVHVQPHEKQMGMDLIDTHP